LKCYCYYFFWKSNIWTIGIWWIIAHLNLDCTVRGYLALISLIEKKTLNGQSSYLAKYIFLHFVFEEERAFSAIEMFTANVLHRTCELIDVDQVRHLLQSLTKDQLNEQDLNKRTALHGHVEILELLLAHDKIDRSIPNIWGQIAEDAASDQVKSNHFFLMMTIVSLNGLILINMLIELPTKIKLIYDNGSPKSLLFDLSKKSIEDILIKLILLIGCHTP